MASEIGLNVRVLRTRRRLSQEDLADKMSTKRSYISEIEHGKHNISMATLVKLAKALRCQLSDLVEGVQLRSK